MQKASLRQQVFGRSRGTRSYGFDDNGAVAYDGSLQMKQFTAQILTFS